MIAPKGAASAHLESIQVGPVTVGDRAEEADPDRPVRLPRVYQRRAAPAVHDGEQPRILIQQQAYRVEVRAARPAGVVERRPAEVVRHLHGRPGVDESAEHGEIAPAAGGVDYRFAKLVARVGMEAGVEEGARRGYVRGAYGLGQRDAVAERLMFLK